MTKGFNDQGLYLREILTDSRAPFPTPDNADSTEVKVVESWNECVCICS